MDKDSTGGGPAATAHVGSGSPSTPGATGDASGGNVHTGVTHTDTASGKGGGQMTQNAAPTAVEENDPDDTSPTNRQAEVGSDNAKSSDIPSASSLFEEERPKGG